MSSFEVRYPSIMSDELNKEELPADFTQEETQLLDPKYFFDNYPHHQFQNPCNFTEESFQYIWKLHAYPLVVIREAYIKIKLRKEETADILQLLRDGGEDKYTLFHFAGSLRHIKDYTVSLRQIRVSLSQKISNVAADLSKQFMGCMLAPETELRKRRGKRGSKKLSKNDYNILLILKEIVSILQGNDQSEVDEGHKRFVDGNSTNNPSAAELMDLVEAGMRQLKAELKQEHSMFIKLIRFVYDELDPTTEEYIEGVTCDKQRHKLNEELYSELNLSCGYLVGDDEDDNRKKVPLQDLINVIDVLSYEDPFGI